MKMTIRTMSTEVRRVAIGGRTDDFERTKVAVELQQYGASVVINECHDVVCTPYCAPGSLSQDQSLLRASHRLGS